MILKVPCTLHDYITHVIFAVFIYLHARVIGTHPCDWHTAVGAYSVRSCRKIVISGVSLNLKSTCALCRYDAVIHLVTAADGAEEFYTLETNEDGVRLESAEQARELDQKTGAAWSSHPAHVIIDNSTGLREAEPPILSHHSRILSRKNTLQTRRLVPFPFCAAFPSSFHMWADQRHSNCCCCPPPAQTSKASCSESSRLYATSWVCPCRRGRSNGASISSAVRISREQALPCRLVIASLPT